MPPKPQLTHFLCLPLSPGRDRSLFVDTFGRLRDAILVETKPSDKAIVNGAMRPIGTLHLTLGVMSLPDDSHIQAAKDLLNSLDLSTLLRTATLRNDVSSTQVSPLHIKSGNLSAMKDPSATSVLYLTPIDESSRLRPFCTSIRDAFHSAGLLVSDHRELKLHATIVNTIYVSGRHNNRRAAQGRQRRPYTFDASHILQKLSHHVWLEHLDLSKISICKMGAIKILSENGESVRDETYEEIASRLLRFT